MDKFLRKRLAALAFASVLFAWAVFGAFLVSVTPVLAQDGARQPELSLPLSCRPGRDCWVVNLVDVDPGLGVRDYACDKQSYDGHKGIDIAIRDLVAMKKGVDVLAAAAGVVKATRDGMRDVDFTLPGSGSVKGRECDNGLVLDHGQGWETQYCHMRRGSVAVQKGDSVNRGRKLGLVGISGKAQFPHVHLSVRRRGQVVDPFAGLGRVKDCGPGAAPLWRSGALAALTGEATALYNAGFAAGAPKPETARSGLLAAARLPADAPALVLWVDMFWAKKGDALNFRVTAPGGGLFLEKTVVLKKTQARRFTFVGRKRKSRRWPPGAYRGEVRLLRKGTKGGAAAGAPGLSPGLSIVREVELR
jgi:hypothetical protein